MKELFMEEKILELVKQEVKNQVTEVLNDTYYDYETNEKDVAIKRDIKLIIKEVIKENISSLVTKEVEATTREKVVTMINEILNNEEIINNGWGKKNIKFEDLVKQELEENIKSYKLDRQVKDILNEKIGKFIKVQTEEVVKQTTDTVIKKLTTLEWMIWNKAQLLSYINYYKQEWRNREDK